jgi:fructose/tagatose bisphosphate aldolase
MGLASSAQFLEMLDAAQAAGYAYPAVNVTSSETLNAALRGLAEAGSDGIVQMTPSGAAFASGGAIGDAAAGACALAEFAHALAERYPVLVTLHTDHCPPGRVDDFLRPLLADAAARRERREQPSSTRICSTARRCPSPRTWPSPAGSSMTPPGWTSCSSWRSASSAARRMGCRERAGSS